MKKLFLLGLILTLLASCGPEHDGGANLGSTISPNPNPDPQLKAAAESILGPQCAGCHGAGSANGAFLNNANAPDLDSLSENSSYVRIGQGSSSLLYLRASDGSMPPGNPLTTTESDAIKAWIDDLGIVEARSGSNTFATIEANILGPKCYSCHQSRVPTFSNYNTVLNTIVIPNNRDSALLRVVKNGSMPPNNPLSASEIQELEDWVLSGASN